MASLAGAAGAVAIWIMVLVLSTFVEADCTPAQTFNATNCRDIYYDGSSGLLYATCVDSQDGTWFTDPRLVGTVINYQNNELQCGSGRTNGLNIQDVCDYQNAVLEETTVFSVMCGGQNLSIDLAECLGVDGPSHLIFDCVYDYTYPIY